MQYMVICHDTLTIVVTLNISYVIQTFLILQCLAQNSIHKLTWRSPDGRTEIQTDPILVNGQWRRSLQDVKARRLADVGNDHNLLMGKLALKLRNAKTGEKKKQRFDTAKLQNPETKQQFTNALKSSLVFWKRKQR